MEVAEVVGQLVTKILPKLLSVIAELHNLENDIECIKLDLKDIQELIGGWSGRPIDGSWIGGLRRLAYDMEDCIDRFQVGKLPRISLATKIGKLKKRSNDKLEHLRRHIRLMTATGQVVPPAADRPVGVEDPEKELDALLQSQSAEEGKLKVISIAGFGGLGMTPMTRLAHKVYNDREDVRNQFPLHAWVHAAGRSAEEVLDQIHNQVLLSKEALDKGMGTSNSNNVPPVKSAEHGASASHVDSLIRLLKTGRYLIVIDDVKTEELRKVLSYFSWADGVGGRIITTTAIAYLPAATYVEACSCGNGSPLAMDSTSQVFIGELTESGFGEACRKLGRDTLARMQRSNNKILSRPDVQDLLLYFCMFPRDHPVRRNPLIRRWLAEGLVFPQPETQNECSQDIAAKNLQMLINSNAIQPIQVRNYEKVKRCQTSVMMLNSISNKNKSENFITMLCGQMTEIDTPGDVRRLSLHLKSTANGRLNLPKGLRRLYTLAVFPDASFACYEANLNYAKYKLLRVLDLKECADLKGKHVGKICDLLLLKYLSLGDSIGEVPRKIAQLRWLETLDMRRTQVVMVPIEVLLLPRLKHLLGKFQLFEGDLGRKKPKKHLAKNSELQRLSGFVTAKSEGFPQLMSHMKQLRKVKIWCNSTADAAELTHLLEAMKIFIREGMNMPTVDRSLSIDFQGCSVECSEPFMDSLQASSHLTSLKLRGKLTRLPQFDASSYIEELCLSGTNLSWPAILRGLRELFLTLKYLKLVEDKLEHFVIKSEHFRSLKGICLVGEHSMEDITIQAGAMRYLVSLHILCEALGDLPNIKITHMAGLKEVALHSGVKDAIKDGWQAAAVAHPNSPNLLFIHPDHRDSPPSKRNGTTTNGTSPTVKIASSIKGIFSCTWGGS